MKRKSLMIPFCPNGWGRGKKSVLWSFAIGALFLASCQQGFENNELFKSDVSNSQLESPKQENISFSRVFNADGTQSVKVSWPVVSGASGYECIAKIVNDPTNPEEVYNDVVDGVSFSFPRERDKHYEVSIRAIGNTSLNNKDAETAVFASLSTYVQPIQIESGDIASSIKSIMDKFGDPEYIFELEAGGNYILNTELDFASSMVTLTSDETNRPLITVGLDGVIRTSTSLTVENILFDCTSINDKNGVVELSANPSASLSAEAQGIICGKSNNFADCYVTQNPIIIQGCAFKNVKCCLFAVGPCSWGVGDVRVIDCVVQLDNDGTHWGDGSVICGYSNAFKAPSGNQFWYGGIKNITMKNNTIYNLQSNGKNRLIRFNNKDLDRVFPTAEGSAIITDNTFYRVYDNKEFGNNTPSNAAYTITFNNNICYDTWRLQKFIQGGCTKNINMATNTIWGIKNSVDNTDKTKYATEEDAAFVGPIDQPLDFTQPNFGVNFKATGTISSTVGDPRWLK